MNCDNEDFLKCRCFKQCLAVIGLTLGVLVIMVAAVTL